MRKIIALLTSAVVAVGLAVPATPAMAQQVGFSINIGNGYDRYDRWDDRWDGPRYHSRWDGPRHRRGNNISVDIGPIKFKAKIGHVERCKARYNSYSARTDKYKTFGGQWKYCRL